MATKYWVGNGGSAGDTAHWSTTSGGTGGASKPTTSDNVIFDSNSFTQPNQVVDFTSSTISAYNFSTHGVTNAPTFTLGTKVLVIAGTTIDFTDSTWTPTTSPLTQNIRFNGTGAVSIVTGGAQIPTVRFMNNASGSVTYTIMDNMVLLPTQWALFTETNDNESVTLDMTGRTVTLPRVQIVNGQQDYIIGGTINVTEYIEWDDFANMICYGTTWNITGNTINATTDASLAVIAGASTSSMLTLTNNSGSSKTISGVTLRNTILNGTSGFVLERVVDDGGNDWGGGGGGPGNPPKKYYVKLPPDYIALP